MHAHSTRSDGTTSPAETVSLAAQEGLGGLALTDHDTLDGWDEAADACRRHNLVFIPGLELSTELAGRSVHVLGYFVDPSNAALNEECERLRSERLRRARAIVDKLRALGIDIPFEAVAQRAGTAPIGRPHIAAAMVDAGAVPDLDSAFDQFLRDGGPAYVAKHALAPDDGVALITAAGGVAVLAHPGISTRDAPVDLALLDALTAAGLAGVEADHAAHDDDVRTYWRNAARERNLYVTGSSDFHGGRKDSRIGAATTDTAAVDALRQLASSAARVQRTVDEEAPW